MEYTGDPNLASQQLHHLPGNRQAQTGAAKTTGDAAIHLFKRFENRRLFFSLSSFHLRSFVGKLLSMTLSNYCVVVTFAAIIVFFKTKAVNHRH